MTSDDANDVTRAFAAFGGPVIRYHSFVQPARQAAAPSFAIPNFDPASPKVQLGTRPSDTEQPSAPVRRVSPPASRKWPSFPVGVEASPVATLFEPVAATVPAVVVAPPPIVAVAASVELVAATRSADPTPKPSPRPGAIPQWAAQTWATVPLPCSTANTQPSSPAPPIAARSLAEVFQLLAGSSEPPIPLIQALPDMLRQM